MSSHFFTYLLILLFIGAVLIPFLARRKPIDWFETIYLYSIFYFVTFGLRAIYLIWFPESETRPYMEVSDIFNRAILYATIGYLAFLIGYKSWFVPRFCRNLRPLARINTGKIHLFIYFTYPLGVIGRLLYLKKGWHLAYKAGESIGEMPVYFGTIGYLYFLSMFGFVIAALLLFSKMKKFGLGFYFWFIIVPAELLWVLLAGSKHGFFPILFCPLAAWNYTRGRVKPRHFIIPLLIFIFAVFPFVAAYRDVVDYGDLKLDTFGTDFKKVMGKTRGAIKERASTGFLQTSLTLFVDRFNGTDAFIRVLENTPEPVEFQHGRTIIGALAVLIPTFIWPNKASVMNPSIDLVPMLFGGKFGIHHAGLAITLPAEFYWNFGILGIIIGMFLVGILYRLFYLYFVKEGNILSTGIYISQLSYLFFVEGWIFHTFQNMLKQTIIFLLFLAILNGGHLFSAKETR